MSVEFIDANGETIDVINDVPKSQNQKGICKVCGEPARTLTSTVCDTHDARKSNNKPTQNKSSKRESVRATPTNPPNASELTNKIFAKILMGVTFFIAVKMVKSKGIKDNDDALADHLSMSKEESIAIALPLGRIFAPTSLNKKYGRSVVENVDVIDAAFSLYDWYSRVNKFLGQPTHLALVHDLPINVDSKDVTNEQNIEETTNAEYSSISDDVISGEHFVI